MVEISGKYTSAIIHTNEIEEYAIAQIRQLCDQPAFEGSRIRIMPDVHPGKVGPIGFTATVTDKIMPSVVGVDIGCGIKIARIRKAKAIEFQKLDAVIRKNIPSGFDTRQIPHRFSEKFDFSRLLCASHIRKEQALRGIGTLGGGNHFIELDKSESGDLYVAIHTGSRHLGMEIAGHYMAVGHDRLSAIGKNIPYELSWLESSQKEAYIHDATVVQEYAALNRQTILDELVRGMKWKIEEEFDCIHNYICREHDGKMVIRKGAISAQNGEKVIIPVNMRDGIILGSGRGNVNWNYSAPHGAGRIANREDVRKSHTVSQFKKEMKGIYSSCIGKETLDEAPFAYRSLEYIQEAVKESVEVQTVLRPVYNFKAGG